MTLKPGEGMTMAVASGQPNSARGPSCKRQALCFLCCLSATLKGAYDVSLKIFSLIFACTVFLVPHSAAPQPPPQHTHARAHTAA